MKQKIYLTLGMAGFLALAGCSSTAEIKDNPEIKETVTANQQGQVQNEQQVAQATPAAQVAPAVAPAQVAAQQHQPAPIIHHAGDQPVPQTAPQQQPIQQQIAGGNVQQQPQIIHEQQPVQKIIVQKQAPRKEKIKISGVGYGAESTYEGFTQGQRRLMAIRASKLDAYRALAEQIYGIKIDSNTSVATLTAQSDSFRARVNAVVKGARVVSITPMADNNYETVLEVFVDRNFFEDVFVYTGNRQDNILEPIETCTMGFNCYEAASYR